jgi:CSLREA domain-containing protein
MRGHLRVVVLACAIFFGAVAALTVPGRAFAALIEVDNTDDFPDENPGDGVCKGALRFAILHRCSLRAAIQEANAHPGIDSIVLEGKTYSLPQVPSNAITAGEDIKDNLTITGVGAGSTVIDLGTVSSVTSFWTVFPQVTARFVGLTISGGNGISILSGATAFLTSAQIDKGRDENIVNGGTLIISNSRITGNVRGTAILNQGVLAIDSTTISNNQNSTGASASAISNLAQGVVGLSSSTVSANSSGGAPGASTIANAGTMVIVNSTISGNSASQAGGIAARTGSLTLTNVTIANNTGIGLFRDASGTFPQNVMFSSNSTNCQNKDGGSIPIAGDPTAHQNFDSDGTCGFPAGSNFTGDPKLGPLAANGGKTLTHDLLAGSPAIDVANCSTAAPADQRGVSRPRDGNNDGIFQCDVGAVERIPITLPPGFPFPPVGTPGLSPSSGNAGVNQTFTQRVTWDVPNVENWHALQTIDYRLRTDRRILLWVRWDELTNLFQPLDEKGNPVGPPLPGEAAITVGSAGVTLDLAGTSGRGSGPTGQRATLVFPLTFGETLQGQTIQVELSATDDLGTSDPFKQVGSIVVGGVAQSAPDPDDGGKVQKDKDAPPRLTDQQRQEKERTNRLGRDDYRTEGNLLATSCDADQPSVTIANRDGTVVVTLLGEAQAVCGSLYPGQYLELDGVKVNEALFEAESVEVSRR